MNRSPKQHNNTNTSPNGALTRIVLWSGGRRQLKSGIKMESEDELIANSEDELECASDEELE